VGGVAARAREHGHLAGPEARPFAGEGEQFEVRGSQLSEQRNAAQQLHVLLDAHGLIPRLAVPRILPVAAGAV